MRTTKVSKLISGDDSRSFGESIDSLLCLLSTYPWAIIQLRPRLFQNHVIGHTLEHFNVIQYGTYYAYSTIKYAEMNLSNLNTMTSLTVLIEYLMVI